ncbi:MAG: VanW family protein [Clostridia bacterium]|nr:VanW family protein [Clostridia bacterium]
MFRSIKGLLSKLLIAAIVLGVLFVSSDEFTAKTEVASVVYGYCEAPLNVRKEMDVDSDWVAQYPADSTIVLLEYLGDWYRVEGGYVSSHFVFDSASIDKLGIVMCCADIYGEANTDSGVIGYVTEEEVCRFVQKKNGFVELATGGWILENTMTFDFIQIYDYPETVLTEADMTSWNMPNLPIQYIGTLTERTKAKGVTTKGGLYFKNSIPVYDIIDGFAYFPSGRNIYKMEVERFMGFEEVGPLNQTLAAYRTVYYTSGRGRKHNIELVSSILDGTIIESGATFSYNNTTGPRSAGMGYQIATVIENGQYVEGYGGGVCQVSSTIYAAIMHDPNINVTSRRKHGLEVTYLPYGMDATVSYGSIDLKFVNNYPFSVKLNVFAMDGVCMVTLTKVEQ